MTAEREAMTLERQAFEKWVLDSREIPADFARGPSGYSSWVTESAWAAWQAAIAHLSRAAEPVAEALRDMVDDYDDVLEGKLPEISAATITRARQALNKVNSTDAEGHVAKPGATAGPVTEKVRGTGCNHTHPPEPARDAKDLRAKFEDWISRQDWFHATLGLGRAHDEYADPAINSRWQGWQAAMAQESGE